MLDLAPADRARTQHGGRAHGHPFHPADHGVVQVRGHRCTGIVGQSRRQLLDEQRVAVGALDDAGHDLGGRRRVEQRAQQVGDVAGTEAVELEVACAPAGQLGRELAQRVPGRDVLAAVGADRAHGQRAGVAGDEGDQVERRAVGPVQVLEDQHDRTRRHEPLDDREEQLEQTGLPGRSGRPEAHAARGAGRHRRRTAGSASTRSSEEVTQRAERGGALLGRQVPVEGAEHVHERCVRQAPLLQVEALTDQHAGAVAPGLGAGLADEARLPHAGLATDEDHGALAALGAGVRVENDLEVARPPDERRAGALSAHGTIIAPMAVLHGFGGGSGGGPGPGDGYRSAVVWLFVVLAAVLVFVIAAVTVGREAFRLGHQPPPTIFDLDEAVAQVADDLPFEAQARLTYDEVRELIRAELDHLEHTGVLAGPGGDVVLPDGDTPDVVLADDESVAIVLGRAEEVGLDVTDEDVHRVITGLHRYLASIGAVGPPADPGSPATG